MVGCPDWHRAHLPLLLQDEPTAAHHSELGSENKETSGLGTIFNADIKLDNSAFPICQHAQTTYHHFPG